MWHWMDDHFRPDWAEAEQNARQPSSSTCELDCTVMECSTQGKQAQNAVALYFWAVVYSHRQFDDSVNWPNLSKVKAGFGPYIPPSFIICCPIWCSYENTLFQMIQLDMVDSHCRQCSQLLQHGFFYLKQSQWSEMIMVYTAIHCTLFFTLVIYTSDNQQQTKWAHWPVYNSSASPAYSV